MGHGEPAAARPAVVTAAKMVAGHVRLDISCVDRLYLTVILSFCLSWGCDLRRPVEDSVMDGTVPSAICEASFPSQPRRTAGFAHGHDDRQVALADRGWLQTGLVPPARLPP